MRTETRTADGEGAGAGVHTTQVAVFGYCEASVERTLGQMTRRENMGARAKGTARKAEIVGSHGMDAGCTDLVPRATAENQLPLRHVLRICRRVVVGCRC